jgi:hypothetical protein
MHLHQIAAAMPRACACRSVRFLGRKARILSNEAKFPQDAQTLGQRSSVRNDAEARLMIRGRSFMIKVPVHL